MKKVFFLVLVSFSVSINAQSKLKPGFDANEYEDLLRISTYHSDSLYPNYVIPVGDNYKKIYRSPVMGLQNRFDVWIKDNSIGIIAIRGTVQQNESWIENFYMGMISSQGSIIV